MLYHPYLPTYISEDFPFFPRRRREPFREWQLKGILWLCEYCFEKSFEDRSSRVHMSSSRKNHLIINFPMGKVMRNGLLPDTIKFFTIDFSLDAYVRDYPRSESERTEIVIQLPRNVMEMTSLHKKESYCTTLEAFIHLMKLLLRPSD